MDIALKKIRNIIQYFKKKDIMIIIIILIITYYTMYITQQENKKQSNMEINVEKIIIVMSYIYNYYFFKGE